MLEIEDLQEGCMVYYYDDNPESIHVYRLNHATVFIDGAGKYTTLRNNILSNLTDDLSGLAIKYPHLINKDFQERLDRIEKKVDSIKSPKRDDTDYYNMVNPDTGRRYDIPLLLASDPEYYEKYVNFMKLKVSSPGTFEKALRWD